MFKKVFLVLIVLFLSSLSAHSAYDRANVASKKALRDLDCEFEDCKPVEPKVIIKEKIVVKEKIVERVVYRDRTPKIKVITNPTTANGYPVDRCYTWATNCDKPVADKICRDNGYAYSRKSIWEHKNPTQLLTTGQMCEESFCGAITYIECVVK